MKTGKQPLRIPRAFTLVELLVAASILSVLVVFCAQLLSHSTSLIKQSSEVMGAYKEGASAFDLMVSHLSAATVDSRPIGLKTDDTRALEDPPVKIGNWSDLMFVCGSPTDLGVTDHAVTHGVFFQAPLGENTTSGATPTLGNALNELGYFVALNGGNAPGFLNAGSKPKRPRLMQFRRRPDRLKVITAVRSTDPFAWFAPALQVDIDAPPPPANSDPVAIYPVANNVIALVVLPQKLAAGTTEKLVPLSSYAFNSRAPAADDAEYRHRLPDAVTVTMVVAGEDSIQRYQAANPATTFDFNQSALFGDPTMYQADLNTLVGNLNNARIQHRVFTTTIRLKEAKR